MPARFEAESGFTSPSDAFGELAKSFVANDLADEVGKPDVSVLSFDELSFGTPSFDAPLGIFDSAPIFFGESNFDSVPDSLKEMAQVMFDGQQWRWPVICHLVRKCPGLCS